MSDILWAPWRHAYVSSSIDNRDKKCVFCDERSELWLFSTEKVRVYLNKFPYNNGHLLVAPIRHVSDISELSREEFHALWDEVMRCKSILQQLMSPDGFNIGMNLGRVSGAGIDQHIHVHIVPRWNGDTNFMPVISDTKVISQSLEELKRLLCEKLSCGKA